MVVRVVDISSWTSECSTSESKGLCSSEVAQALEETGMVVVTGHGIPPSTLKDLKTESLRWFQETEDKRAYTTGPYGCANGGYTAIGVEAVAASTEGNLVALDNVDAIESFVFPGQPSKKFATEDAPSMLVKADEYYVELVKLLRTLHAILCNALGIQEDYFYQNLIIPDENIGHSLKLSYYPPMSSPNIPHSSISRKLRYGAHTDFQDVTILKPDIGDWTALSDTDPSSRGNGHGEIPTTGGLQVFTQSGTWEAVVIHDDDALCVNLGDFWEIWSNGRFRSPLHRVTMSGYPLASDLVKPLRKKEEEVTLEQSRFSAVFFSIPNNSSIIEPLPGTKSLESPDDASKMVPLTAGEHLDKKLKRINNTS